MKRIIVMGCILMTLLSILGGCIFNRETKEWNDLESKDYLLDTEQELMEIAVTSDIHYLSPELTDGQKAYQTFVDSGDGKQMKYMDAILEAFSDTLEEEQTDVLIVSGDLTINGEKKSHEDLAKIFGAIEETGTEVLVIPGNHDVLNPYARGFEGDSQVKVDSVSADEFRTIYSAFGFDESITEDKSTLSYIVPLNERVWVMMLDTCIYNNNMKQRYPEIDGQISEETLDWIRECSDEAAAVGAKVVTVTHQNLLDHSDLINDGFTLRNSEEVQRVFKEQQLLLNLSGHVHVQDIATDFMKPQESYDIASGALSVYPHQFGIMTIDSSKGHLLYQTEEVPVEKWAEATGQQDDNLLEFDTYKATYFGQYAYDMAIAAYGELEEISQDTLEIVARSMERLNLRYFAGREEENLTDQLVQEGMGYLDELPDSFIKPYAKSIVNDPDIEDNALELTDDMW